MTDLISREAAIALLKSEFYEQCPKGSVQRLLFANAIEALTNMPSEALREDDNLYIGRPNVEPPFTVTLDTKKLP